MGKIIPIIRKVSVDPFSLPPVSVNPTNLPSDLVFKMDFNYAVHAGVRVFHMFEELWLEDDKDGGYWCPQISNDAYISEIEFYDMFRDMRMRTLIFEDWEIEQMNQTWKEHEDLVWNSKINGFVVNTFKACWFPEKKYFKR